MTHIKKRLNSNSIGDFEARMALVRELPESADSP
jgi:hypothetical protein